MNRQPSQIRELTATEAAWIGGFVDGEGYLKIRWDAIMKCWRYRLVVVNTNVEHIATLLRLTQVGRINVRLRNAPHNNVWVWQVSAINDVFALAQQLTPYSIKAQEFLCAVS